MDRVEVVCVIVCSIVMVGAIAWAWGATDELEDRNDPNQSADYIGGGLYGCPNCNWTGYIGLMVIVDGGFLMNDLHYCPECGHEIDVRESE